MKREFSAGGAVYQQPTANSQQPILWLIAKHSGYHKWVLPKGLIDEGEKSEETALREVEEETGIKGKILAKILPAEKYVYTFNGEKIFKVVQYYLMEYVAGDVTSHDWEMETVEWLPFEEAYKRLDFGGQKQVLKQAREIIGKKAEI